jgi:hypothetical protein
MTEAATRVQTRFALDEDTTRAWLAAGTGADFMDHMAAGNTLPEIDPGWIPGTSEQDAIGGLLAAAQAHGVIAAPAGVHVALEVDGGGEGYRWFVYLRHGSEQRLTLASTFVDAAVIGRAGTSGADAAVGVLREAVDSANECLNGLFAYREATRSSGDPDAEIVIEVHGQLTEPAERRIGELLGEHLGRHKPWSTHYVFGPMTVARAGAVCDYLETLGIAHDRETTTRWRPDGERADTPGAAGEAGR